MFVLDKADKKLEKEKQEKAEQERQDREEELRGIAIKLRKRLFTFSVHELVLI